MAINIHDKYPSNTASPSTEYPYGSFRDRSSPTSDDGTTLQQDWSNDFFTLQWRLLVEAGIVPNGSVDTVENSQYFDALIEVIRQNTQKLTTSDEYDGTSKELVATEYAVGEVYRRSIRRTGDTMTGSLNMLNNSIPANNTGAIVEFSNTAGTGTFTTRPEMGNAQQLVHKLPTRSGTLSLGNTASGADNGWLRDEVTGITFKWGEVNYTYNESGSVTVTFPQPYVSACYNVQLTRKTARADQHGKAGALLISKSRTGFVVALNKFNESQTGSARGFSWFAIGK